MDVKALDASVQAVQNAKIAYTDLLEACGEVGVPYEFTILAGRGVQLVQRGSMTKIEGIVIFIDKKYKGDAVAMRGRMDTQERATKLVEGEESRLMHSRVRKMMLDGINWM